MGAVDDGKASVCPAKPKPDVGTQQSELLGGVQHLTTVERELLEYEEGEGQLVNAWCVVCETKYGHKPPRRYGRRRLFEPLFYKANKYWFPFISPTYKLSPKRPTAPTRMRIFALSLQVLFSSSCPETGVRETNYLFISSTDVRLPATLPTPSVSQWLAGLRRRMRWWLASSDHGVRSVLLAGFDRAKQRRAVTVRAERWGVGGFVLEVGATTTRNAEAVQPPVLRQPSRFLKITRLRSNSAACVVSGVALLLGYSLMFLRDLGPREGDVVLGVEPLERYSAGVWAVL
jgi:hypothetical protein